MNFSKLPKMILNKFVLQPNYIVDFFLPQFISWLVINRNEEIEKLFLRKCFQCSSFAIKSQCYLQNLSHNSTFKNKEYCQSLIIKLKISTSSNINSSIIPEICKGKAFIKQRIQRKSPTTEKISIHKQKSNENIPIKITSAIDLLNQFKMISFKMEAVDLDENDNLLKSLIKRINLNSFDQIPFDLSFLHPNVLFLQFTVDRSVCLSPKRNSPFIVFFEIIRMDELEKGNELKYPISNGRFAKIKREIQSSSAFGKTKGWDVLPFIYKNDQHIRQEVLAMQLIRLFDEIWKHAKLPLKLTLYDVLVVSESGGLVEVITDSISLDQIKRQSNSISLLEYFKQQWKNEGPNSLNEARKNFTKSMAAYSLITYFLQLNDRHNGNILIGSEGNVVHIDFGYFLSNSPGRNVNFESVPFKLTSEHLEVIKGGDECYFSLFKLLVIRGFLEARKHWDTISMMVEMMQKIDSDLPCLRETTTVQKLVDRFCIEKSDEECIEYAVWLIEESLDNWRTEQYDSYQRIANGIL